MALTNSQVDKLGDRLKRAVEAGEPITESDRALLLEFRASFLPVFLVVMARITEATGVRPRGRPEKTPESIIAKLSREGTNLASMQDIAGCRVTVPTKPRQNEFVEALLGAFQDHRMVDRRERPRHGYRAVHVIVREQGRRVEIQIRTDLQDRWANLVEELAKDGGDLKHGIEPPRLTGLLGAMERASQEIADLERSGLEAGGESIAPELARVYRAGLFHGIMSVVLNGVGK